MELWSFYNIHRIETMFKGKTKALVPLAPNITDDANTWSDLGGGGAKIPFFWVIYAPSKRSSEWDHFLYRICEE